MNERRVTPIQGLLLWGAIGVSLALSSYAVIAVFWKGSEFKAAASVCVGMSRKDVISKLGEPRGVFGPGETVQPQHVNGFVPDHENDHGVVVYRTFSDMFLVIYFGSDDRVVCCYITWS